MKCNHSSIDKGFASAKDCPICLRSALTEKEKECERMWLGLDRAAYALFQIKRMVPEAIHDFAAKSHEKACAILDNEQALKGDK
jgi:hypothetical protein